MSTGTFLKLPAVVASSLSPATDALYAHLAGAEAFTGVKTFTADPVFNAAAIPQAAVANLVTNLAAKATDTLVAHLAGTETITGAKTFSALTTFNGEVDIATGTENTPLFFVGANGVYSSGSLLGITYNHHKLMTVQSPGLVQVWSGDANNWGGTIQSALYNIGSTLDGNQHGALGWLNTGGNGVVQLAQGNTTPATSAPSKLPFMFATGLDTAGGSASVAVWASHYAYSSTSNATTRTLPTPANSYVGQTLYFIQEASHVFTVTAPTGVTLSMQTAAATVTTKTAASFVTSGAAGADGTSAMLVCTSTDTSTVAAWRQVGGVGVWT